MNKIFKCIKCNLYTLEKICKKCGSKTFSPKPAKYSPEKEEKIGYYRRIYKEKQKQ